MKSKSRNRAAGPMKKEDGFSRGGGKLGGVRAVSAFQRVLESQDKSVARGRSRRAARESSRSRGHRGYYGYYANAPVPTAYNWASDVRLDDLTELVPSFIVDAFDVELEQLRKALGQRKGSITGAAASLVRRARAEMRPTRYRTEDGQILTVDAQGRFRLERKLDTGLMETIAFTGTHLYHLYPELDIAVRRDVEGSAPLLYGQVAPFLLPDAASMARWYYVSLSGARTLRLSMSSKPDAPAVEIALDEALRVAEVRTVVDGKRVVDLSVERGDGKLVLAVGGERATLSAEPVDGMPAAVDESQWTVAEMPLRQPAYWSKKAEELQAGSADWRYAQRQLLASYAALGNGSKLWQVLGKLAEAEGPITRGELALASRAARWASDKKKRAETLAGMEDDDPVAAYFRASQELAHNYRSKVFDKLTKSSAGSLIGMLSAYRGVLGTMYYDANRKLGLRRYAAFVADYAPTALHYIAAYQIGSQWGYQAPAEVAEVWDLYAAKAAGPGPWATIANYQAARVLYNARKFDAATDRFEKLLDDARKGGYTPTLDRTVQWAFNQSSRGQAGWRLFWNRWREQALKSSEPSVLMSLLRSAQACGMAADTDRIVSRLSQLDIKDPEMVILLSDLLNQNGRADQALAVLGPWLGEGDDADPDMLQRASYIAERHGRHAAAIGYLERSMEIFYEEEAELSAIRTDYQRLINLYGRRAQVAAGAEREELQEKALDAAAEWRKVDPDNSQIDRLTATMLYSLGRPEEAWRYLSTAIEKHPMEGSAYQVVADALEAEGRLDQAEPMWRRAYEVEPTNPTWLLRRSQALFAMGERDSARELLGKITKQEWHERFFNVKYQAEQLARRQEQAR